MSSRKIDDLVPALVALYYKFADECDRQGLQFIVTCTKRLRAEQKALVASGASKTMNSKHLTGKAFDIAVMKNGKVSWVFDDYKPYGKIGEDLGLEWGGSWKFRDGPHFQLKEVT
jgi:peptidoglycan L-alanyl-D-glutamate endopeptidase CwlK